MDSKMIEESKLIKAPQLASFRRFIHLDSFEDGLTYDQISPEGVKRVLAKIFPMKISSGNGTRCEAEITGYELKKGVFIFKEKESKGIAINLTLQKTTYDRHGALKKDKKEKFRLCVLPELSSTGHFRFNKIEGGAVLKCPIGQIIRAPGLFFGINKWGIFCTIRPSYGKQLKIIYGKFQRRDTEMSFYLVSLAKANKKLLLGRLLDYLDSSDKKEYRDVEEFLQYYIAPSNPLSYDLSTLGRKNINERLGINSDNSVLNIDDIILAAGIMLNAPYFEDSSLEISFSTKDKKNIDEIIARCKLNLCIDKIYVNEYINDGLVCIEKAEKRKLLMSLHQIIKTSDPSNYDTQIQTILKKNIFYNLKKKIKEINHKCSFKFYEDDCYHLKNKKVNLIGNFLEKVFRQHFIGVLTDLPIYEKQIVENPSKNIFTFLNLVGLQQRINKFIKLSSMIHQLNRCNPLADISDRRKLTFFGESKTKGMKGAVMLRDIHYSMHSKICPLETPQGPVTGLNISLARYADIDSSGHIIAPHKKNKSGKLEYKSAAAVEKVVVKPHSGSSEARKEEAEIIPVDKNENHYCDVSPNQMIGLGASLIPFLGHNDAPRAMMAISMMKQALPLIHPDVPLIKTGHEKTVARESGWSVYADHDGVVNKVTKSFIKIGKKKYPLTDHASTIQKSIYHHTPVVKEKDRVVSGQLIVDGSGTINGELTLGKNLLTAFMFYKGYNYEDAIVISESACKKLTSLRVTEIICDVKMDEKFTSTIDGKTVDYLADNGVVKPETEVSPGMILVGKERPVKKDEVSDSVQKLVDELVKTFGINSEYRDTSFKVPKGVFGKVIETRMVEISKGEHLYKKQNKTISKYKIRIKILEKKTAKIGDKLANRHGNKGVISMVLPDDQMPQMVNGKTVEVLLNPLGVLNRMNVGQLLEMHLSWVASNPGNGKSMVVPQFMEGNSIVGLAKKGFKKHGLDSCGKVHLKDGKNGNMFINPVSVGFQYMLKLNHLSSDKTSVRAVGPYSVFLQQPFQGKQSFADFTIYGGQRIGEMEVWALEAYNASETLKELLSHKSDDTAGRAILLGKFKNDDGSPTETYLPYSFKQMVAILRGLCINITASGKKDKMIDMLSGQLLKTNDLKNLGMLLMSNEDILNISSGKIGTREGLIRKEDLFNENIFGPEYDFRCECGFFKNKSWGNNDRCPQCAAYVAKRKNILNFKMGHIELPFLIPHPLYGKYASVILGQSIQEFIENCIENNVNPEDELSSVLKPVNKNIDQLIKTEQEAETVNVERLKAYEAFKANRCLFIKYLPVISVHCRLKLDNFEPPLHKTYVKLIKLCNRIQLIKKSECPAIVLASEYLKLYKAVDRHVSNLINELKGKEGLIRRDLLGKRADFSGRIVVVPEPEFEMNQCGLPLDFLCELFKPRLIKKLIKNKEITLREEYDSYLRNNIKSEKFIKLLNDMIKKKVILLNRFPTLHRMNIQAFYPKIIKEKNVMKIPTTICSAFNADFDGDQFSIHLPISNKAQNEAKNNCLPSQNLISPASGLLTPVSLNKDIVVGLYWLTAQRNARGKTKEFDAMKEAFAYAKNRFNEPSEKVKFKKRNGEEIESTTGRIIFNQACGLEEDHFFNEEINQKILDKFLLNYLKRHGYNKVISVIENLKELGFKMATTSGVSISYFDLPSSRINIKKHGVEKIQNDIVNQLNKDKSNPVSLFFLSGAGKKSSLTQICGMRGRMARPDGSEVPYPVLSNFKNGLSPLEYFVSGHGGRKGSVDKAISTTKSGYLMRKIVECVHPVRIGKDKKSCVNTKGIIKRDLKDANNKVLLPLSDRIYLRYAANDIKGAGKKVIVRRGELIDDNVIEKIHQSEIKEVRVMSPITCHHSVHHLCCKCYGNLFNTKEAAPPGVAAGIIAAQSISEPCTQLAMRVFHKGGIAEADITGGFARLVDLLEGRKMPMVTFHGGGGTNLIIDEIFSSVSARKVPIIAVYKEAIEEGAIANEFNKLADLFKGRKIPLIVVHEWKIAREDNNKLIDLFKKRKIPLISIQMVQGEKYIYLYMIDEIQKIFLSEGVKIDDRHIEVVLREVAKNGNLLGVKKVARTREGFLSKISFENLKQMLIASSVEGSIDIFSGLKEKVLIAKSI